MSGHRYFDGCKHRRLGEPIKLGAFAPSVALGKASAHGANLSLRGDSRTGAAVASERASLEMLKLRGAANHALSLLKMPSRKLHENCGRESSRPQTR